MAVLSVVVLPKVVLLVVDLLKVVLPVVVRVVGRAEPKQVTPAAWPGKQFCLLECSQSSNRLSVPVHTQSAIPHFCPLWGLPYGEPLSGMPVL